MDRLTFSVIWDLSDDGQVLSQWAGRTVIRTCAKLAYEHAQAMIEGTFDTAKPPVALSRPHTWPQVRPSIMGTSLGASQMHEYIAYGEHCLCAGSLLHSGTCFHLNSVGP